jgi:hypothetical protein
MANWLDFSSIANWDWVCISGFQYDSVTDDEISRALAQSEIIDNVDPNIDFEDDEWLADTDRISDDQKHAFRVAALVAMIRRGGKLREPIILDTFNVRQCCSCVANGHHRVRALQYLGYAAGPFSLSGTVSLLKELVAVAGVAPPDDVLTWCEPALAKMQRYDIRSSARKPSAGVR